MTPLVKVCGVTDASFAAEAARMGVDYVGVIFAESSPRRVSVQRAREIAAAARAAGNGRLRVVGVFVGQDADEIASVAAEVPLDVVQLHGGYDEKSARRLRGLGLETWRLMSDGYFPDPAAWTADAVLLDGRSGGRTGGTGCLADWRQVAALRRDGRRVVLAGGLSAENASAAAGTLADVLDVNSGVETAPGEKSAGLLAGFLRAVR